MRDFEKYWNEYIILGYPIRPFGFFIEFAIKKGACPTVYADKVSKLAKHVGLAKFCVFQPLSDDGQILELLLRHAKARAGKRLILICTPYFSDFAERNRNELEKYFLITETEGMYEA